MEQVQSRLKMMRIPLVVALTVLAIVPLQVCAEEFLEVLSEQVFPHSRFNDDRQFTRVEEEHIRSLYRETNNLYQDFVLIGFRSERAAVIAIFEIFLLTNSSPTTLCRAGVNLRLFASDPEGESTSSEYFAFIRNFGEFVNLKEVDHCRISSAADLTSFTYSTTVFPDETLLRIRQWSETVDLSEECEESVGPSSLNEIQFLGTMNSHDVDVIVPFVKILSEKNVPLQISLSRKGESYSVLSCSVVL